MFKKVHHHKKTKADATDIKHTIEKICLASLFTHNIDAMM